MAGSLVSYMFDKDQTCRLGLCMSRFVLVIPSTIQENIYVPGGVGYFCSIVKFSSLSYECEEFMSHIPCVLHTSPTSFSLAKHHQWPAKHHKWPE